MGVVKERKPTWFEYNTGGENSRGQLYFAYNTYDNLTNQDLDIVLLHFITH